MRRELKEEHPKNPFNSRLAPPNSQLAATPYVRCCQTGGLFRFFGTGKLFGSCILFGTCKFSGTNQGCCTVRYGAVDERFL